MPKNILTDRDIDDLAQQGITSLTLAEDTILTDLANEKARRLGIKLVSASSTERPPAMAQPNLSGLLVQGSAPEYEGQKALPAQNILRFTARAGEAELRAAIVETGKLAYQSGLMISNDGNISARMADGNILMTPSGVCKGRINPADLLIIDINGKVVRPAADPALRPTSEQPMHLEVYRSRPDVRAVIHTHLIFANALIISKGKIRMDVIPEAAIAFGSVPVTEYSMPSSGQNAEVIRGLIATHNVVLIRNHGALAVGKDLDEALIHMERLEHVAKTLTYAELLGNVNALPPEMLEAIRQASRR